MDTGRFFGEIEGKAMQKLVELDIFKIITVYDYQAVCKESKPDENAPKSFASIIMTVYDCLLLQIKLNVYMRLNA